MTKAPEYVVLKFASSVLRRRADLPRAVSEIYLHVRAGRKVIAIVAALDGDTERLTADAAATGAGLSSRHSAGYIALGEARAAYALALACDASGLDADVLEAKELRLHAEGPFDDAAPMGVDPGPIRDALAVCEVVIAPGYVAVGPDGGLVLLGRGGSDLTAIVVAEALGVREAIFLTAVGGLYDHDPLTDERLPDEAARRFDRVSWSDVATLAGDPIQAKALSYAERQGVALRLIAPGSEIGTIVASAGEPPRRVERVARLRVGVAGLGVVGEGAALRIVFEPERYDFAGALVAGLGKPRHRQIDPSRIFGDLDVFLASAPDVVIDAMSCGAAGFALTEAALSRGISVVSANKQAICDHLPKLAALAESTGSQFHFAASVGGGAPLIETAARAREAGGAGDILAVVNGTVNYILSEVAAGRSFDDALRAAQAAGFAEADPSADLSGDDARAKGKILAFVAYAADPGAVTTDIEPLDARRAAALARSGGVWRQATRITRRGERGAHVEVRFERVDGDPVFAGLRGEENAMRIDTAVGALVCRGRGAGRTPTVEALLADLADVERSRARARENRP